jgi:hypothetical protein
MPIHVDKYPLNFSGRIGLDKSLDMTVILPLTVALKTAKVGGDSDMRIPVPIGGTLDNPTIDFRSLIEEAGKKLIEDQLKKALEDIFR